MGLDQGIQNERCSITDPYLMHWRPSLGDDLDVVLKCYNTGNIGLLLCDYLYCEMSFIIAGLLRSGKIQGKL